jgi:sugar phosphate isomerase/epimerase
MTANIALQLYTLRQQAAADFPGMLREVANAGYDAVEFAGYGGLEARELRALIDRLGLRAISSHVPYQHFAQDAAAAIDELKLLGCRYAIVPGIPQELRGEESVPSLTANFNAWGEQCRAAGLHFGYHNHGWELEPRGETTFLDLLAAETDPSLVDLQIDVYWTLVAGADPVALIARNAGRVPTLHAKELLSDGESRDTTVGDGVTPWPEVLAAARAAGTEWFIVEQEDDPEHAYRDIRRSMLNLRRLLANSFDPPQE